MTTALPCRALRLAPAWEGSKPQHMEEGESSSGPSLKCRQTPSLPSISPKLAEGTESRTAAETEKKVTGL